VIDLPPPYPPAVECISASSPAVINVKALLTLSGDPAQVGAVLEEAQRAPTAWHLDADVQSNGIRFVRLSAGGDDPYRLVGGLIFEAQRRRLSVAWMAEPPICTPETE
jgi:hypothetical protein